MTSQLGIVAAATTPALPTAAGFTSPAAAAALTGGFPIAVSQSPAVSNILEYIYNMKGALVSKAHYEQDGATMLKSFRYPEHGLGNLALSNGQPLCESIISIQENSLLSSIHIVTLVSKNLKNDLI